MIDTSIYRVICDGQVRSEWTRFTAAMDHAESLTGDVQIEQDCYTRDGYKCTFVLFHSSESLDDDLDRFDTPIMVKQTLTITVEYYDSYHAAPPSEWDWSALATMEDGSVPVKVTVR